YWVNYINYISRVNGIRAILRGHEDRVLIHLASEVETGMPNTDDFTGWVVQPEDDGFHDHVEGADHPWWMETFWTSFNVPERKMGGWFYNQVLKNQGEHGICNGGAWVWDA